MAVTRVTSDDRTNAFLLAEEAAPLTGAMEMVERLKKDVRANAVNLTPEMVRILVRTYDDVQKYRIASGNQLRTTLEAGGSPDLFKYVHQNFKVTEDEIRTWLDVYTKNDSTNVGPWLRAICGIGPVLAAGLKAHIDIHRAPTVGNIWAYVGYDPTRIWDKGQKRPWNADAKVLCYKIGTSFQKVQSRKNDTYGKLIAARKAREIALNETGAFAAQAEAILAKKKIGKDTIAYESYSVGKLPKAHIDARARRWGVKLFLSHFHTVLFWATFKELTPLPWPVLYMQDQGHIHVIEPPYMEMFPGLREAREAAFYKPSPFGARPIHLSEAS